MTAPVQGVGSQVGSQGVNPIAEAGQWKDTTLKSVPNSSRVDGAIKAGFVLAASKEALVAPTCAAIRVGDMVIPAGTELIEIAKTNPDLAQEILTSRNEAMKEFFDGWAESIRKIAAADKKSAFAAMLKQARLRALSQARMFVSGKGPTALSQNSSNGAATANRAPGVRAVASTTLAAGGVNGAFSPTQDGKGGFGLRNT